MTEHTDPDRTELEPGGRRAEPSKPALPDEPAKPASPAEPAKPEVPAEPDDSARPAEPVEPTEGEFYVASERRAPKYGRFIGFGMLAGVLAAFILYLVGPNAGVYEGRDVVIVLMMYLVPLGGFLGAILALVLDGRSVKKSRQ